MVELSRNEWIIIGVIILAVIILGSIGYYVYSKGEVGKEGIQFQTGFGLGPSGNPGHGYNGYNDKKTYRQGHGGTQPFCPLGPA